MGGMRGMRRRDRTARLGIDRLERREVPTAIPAANGVIWLYGTTGDDVMLVEPGDEPGLTRVTGSVSGVPFELEYSDAKWVVLYAGSGDDVFENQTDDLRAVVYGAAGNDLLVGGPLADRLYGENGDDIIQGGSGNDLLDGGNGNDILAGDLGSDSLYGGNGNDDLDGGIHDYAVDIMVGGAGADTFQVELMIVGRSTRRRDQVRDFRSAQRDFLYTYYPI